MNRRRMLFSLLIAATALAASYSQLSEAADEAPAQSFETQIAEMRERLALTPEQEHKLAPILEDRNDKLREVLARRDPNASLREKRGMMKEVKAIQEAFDQKISPILTKDQMKTWQAYRDEMKQEARERYRNRKNQ